MVPSDVVPGAKRGSAGVSGSLAESRPGPVGSGHRRFSHGDTGAVVAGGPRGSTAEEEAVNAGARRGELGLRAGWSWELSLLPLCVASVGYSLWMALGQAHVGSVAVDPLDVGLAVAFVAWAVVLFRRGIVDPTPTVWLAAVCIVGVLCTPVLIGFAQGHDWQSVLREARVAASYSLLAIAPQLLKDRRSAERLMLMLMGLTIAAAGFAFASLVFGWQWQSGLAQVPTSFGIVNRGYGLPSAIPWYCVGALLCLAYAFFADGDRWWRGGAGVAGIGLSGVTIATLVRGNYVALLAGLLAILAAAIVQRGGVRSFVCWLGWRRATGAALIVLVAAVALGLTQPRFVSILTQRAASVVETGTSAGADHNRQLRVLALDAGAKSAVEAPLGVGYGWRGDGQNIPTLSERTVAYFGSHSSFAWAGFYLGVVGSMIIFLGCLPLVRRELKGLGGKGDVWWVSAAVVSAGVALLAQSIGAAVLFADPETYAMVPVLLAAGLVATRLDATSIHLEVGGGTPSERRLSFLRFKQAMRDSLAGPWALAWVAAAASAVFIAAAAIVLVMTSSGQTLAMGTTVYGRPPRLVIAPAAAAITDAGRVVGLAGENSYWPKVPVWYMPTSGSASAVVRVGKTGPYLITLNAFGTPADDVGPLVGLSVDGVARGQAVYIGYYPFSYAWTLPLLRGSHTIRVTYLNDATIDGQYRNLYVESVTIESLGGSAAARLVRPAKVRQQS